VAFYTVFSDRSRRARRRGPRARLTPPDSPAIDGKAVDDELRAHYRWVQELPVQWARDLDYYLLELGRLGSVALDGLPLPALWAHALEIDRLGREYFRPNIAISITQRLLHRLLFQIVAQVVGRDNAPAVYDGLTCFCETKTGLVNGDLYRLAAHAREDAVLARRLIEGDRRALFESGAIDEFPGFARRLRRFLTLHGHREVDFDAYHPTWSGQPWVVLENLRLILLREVREDPGLKDQAARGRQHATEQAFLARVPVALAAFIGEIIRLARTYTALDARQNAKNTQAPRRTAAGSVSFPAKTNGTNTNPFLIQ